MKPKHFYIQVSISAYSDQPNAEGAEGIDIYNIAFEFDPEAPTPEIVGLMEDLGSAAEDRRLLGWALEQRFHRLPLEMEGDPEQEASLTTLFGRVT